MPPGILSQGCSEPHGAGTGAHSTSVGPGEAEVISPVSHKAGPCKCSLCTKQMKVRNIQRVMYGPDAQKHNPFPLIIKWIIERGRRLNQ